MVCHWILNISSGVDYQFNNIPQFSVSKKKLNLKHIVYVKFNIYMNIWLHMLQHIEMYTHPTAYSFVSVVYNE